MNEQCACILVSYMLCTLTVLSILTQPKNPYITRLYSNCKPQMYLKSTNNLSAINKWLGNPSLMFQRAGRVYFFRLLGYGEKYLSHPITSYFTFKTWKHNRPSDLKILYWKMKIARTFQNCGIYYITIYNNYNHHTRKLILKRKQMHVQVNLVTLENTPKW